MSSSLLLQLRGDTIEIVSLKCRNPVSMQRVEKMGVSSQASSLLRCIESCTKNVEVGNTVSPVLWQRQTVLFSKLDMALRCVSQFLSDRLTLICGLRGDVAKQLKLCVVWYEDFMCCSDTVHKCLIEIERIMNITGSVSQNKLVRNPSFSLILRQYKILLTSVLPHLHNCFSRCLAATIEHAVCAILDWHFSSNSREFLPLSNSVYPFRCNSAHSGSDSDASIFRLVKSQSYDLLTSSMNSLSCELSVKHTYLLSICINAALDGLFESIRIHEMRIDEEGLYVLFRVTLRLQELVQDSKRSMNLQSCNSLVHDIAPWKRAQLILNIINQEIFHGSNCQNEPAGLLSDHECALFKSIASRSSDRLWYEKCLESIKWKKKRKGTIFVALAIDFANL